MFLVVAHRIYALSPKPLEADDALLADCERGVDVADWWICAEFAGVEDDDEASALVDRICDSQSAKITSRPDARAILELSYDAGKITFQALRGHARAKTHELRMFVAQ